MKTSFVLNILPQLSHLNICRSVSLFISVLILAASHLVVLEPWAFDVSLLCSILQEINKRKDFVLVLTSIYLNEYHVNIIAIKLLLACNT